MTTSCRNFPLPNGTVLWARVTVHETVNSHRGRVLVDASRNLHRVHLDAVSGNRTTVAPRLCQASWGEPTASRTLRTEPYEWSRGIVLFTRADAFRSESAVPPCAQFAGEESLPDLRQRPFDSGSSEGDGFEAKIVFSRFPVAAQPLAKRWPRDATTRSHETGVASLVIHAHPT